MVSINQMLMDRSVRHAIYLTRVAGGEAAWVRQQMPAFQKSLERRIQPYITHLSPGSVLSSDDINRLEQISNIVDRETKSFFDTLYNQHEERMRAFANREIRFENKLFNEIIPMERAFKQPTDTYIRTLLGKDPIGGTTVRGWFDKISANAHVRINDQLRQGLIAGESTNDLMRRIRGTRENKFTDGIISRSGRDAENIVRTGVMNASNQAREAFHKENQEVIKGYQIVLTLDDRTCLVCVDAENSNPYELHSPPHPPLHLLCRCVQVPILKSWEELGFTELEEIDPGMRASMDGQVPETQTYSEWLANQSPERQKEILGARRFESYQKGMPVERFVDDGRILKVSELDQLEGLEPVEEPLQGYREAKTIEEAEEIAKQYFDRVDYSDIDLDAANMINQGADYVEKEFPGLLSTSRGESLALWSRFNDTNAYAHFSTSPGDPGKAWRFPTTMRWKAITGDQWNSTLKSSYLNNPTWGIRGGNNFQSIIVHESAHALEARAAFAKFKFNPATQFKATPAQADKIRRAYDQRAIANEILTAAKKEMGIPITATPSHPELAYLGRYAKKNISEELAQAWKDAYMNPGKNLFSTLVMKHSKLVAKKYGLIL